MLGNILNKINLITKNKFTSDFSNFYAFSRLEKKNVKQGVDTNGYNYYSYYLKDSLSSKAIKVKKVLASVSYTEMLSVKTIK